MELGIEKYIILIMKSGKVIEGIEMPNEEIIRKLGEKKNYKSSGILEGSVLKKQLWKKKYKKCTSNESENFTKACSAVEISSKKLTPE